MWQNELKLKTSGQNLYLITSKVERELALHNSKQGILNLFIQHTSASLLIQENADPSAKADLLEFFSRLVPENQSWYRHTLEGPDDTTSHLKSALTQTSLNIPVRAGKLALGTWQGIYLFEHRHAPHERNLLLTFVGE